MIKNKIDKIFEKSSGKKICIIGDIMLDRYLLGDVTRISPEAPVQVFDIKNTEPKLGGAANVSLNIKTNRYNRQGYRRRNTKTGDARSGTEHRRDNNG